MNQTSERAEPSERVEQIWSGWSKFGVGGEDVGRTVWRVADRLCCVSFYFRGLNF